MDRIINLLVIVATGVIVADLVKNFQGTATLFNGVASIWQTSVNGMLGQPTSAQAPAQTSNSPAPAKK